MRRIWLLSLGLVLGLSGCSSLRSAPHRLVIEKRWVRSTLNEDYLGGRRIHRFAPLLDNHLVIVGNSIDGLAAYDRDSAHLKWRLDIKDGDEGGAYLSEGILYFGAGDGQLYAIQPEDGKVLWTYPLKAEGLARPIVKAGVLYVLGGNNIVHALNAKTGKLNWVYNRREASNISVRGGSQPAVVGDLLLVGFSDGTLAALNKTSGAVVWEANLNHAQRFRDVDATPIVDGNNVYVSSYDGALYNVSVTDGKILWNVDEGGFEEVVLAGNTLYYCTTSGKTMAVDKVSGKVLWSKDNPEGVATGPSLMKGVLLVGEMSGALRFLDARTGDLLNRFEPGRGVTSRATVDVKKGEVYFMSHDANLFALQMNWKRHAKDWPWE